MSNVIRVDFNTKISDLIKTQVKKLNDPEGYTPAEVRYSVDDGKHSLTLKLHIVTVHAKHYPQDTQVAVEIYLRNFANVFKCEYADALYIHKEVMKVFTDKRHPSYSVNRAREGYVAIYKNSDFVVFISSVPFN